MIEFLESGMIFRLDENNCFRIEKHPKARKSYRNCTQGVKACEFVTYANGRHVFVEAKSSAPQAPAGLIEDLTLNGCPIPKNWTVYDNYRTFLRNVCQKFIDSFSLLKAISDGCHGYSEKLNLTLAQPFSDIKKIEFVLILNIAGATNNKRESLVGLRDALVNEMRPFFDLWNISTDAMKVFWPEQAQIRYGFLIDLSVKSMVKK